MLSAPLDQRVRSTVRRDSRPTGALRPEQVHRALAGAALALDLSTSGAVGVDVVDIVEFAHNLDIGGERFAVRLFTEGELAYCGGRAEQLAPRFAAKEAVSKVLGTGFRGVRPTDIEIRTAPEGRPTVTLTGGAADAAAAVGFESVLISMSREGACAAAVAVGLRGAK